jgi:hypothetical protein
VPFRERDHFTVIHAIAKLSGKTTISATALHPPSECLIPSTTSNATLIETALANAAAMMGRVRQMIADHNSPMPAEATAKTAHTMIAVMASSPASAHSSYRLPFVPLRMAHRQLDPLPDSKSPLVTDNCHTDRVAKTV